MRDSLTSEFVRWPKEIIGTMAENLKFCDNCKKEVSGDNFTVHTVHCQRSITRCSVCHEPVPKSQYQQHIESTHKTLTCENCGQQVNSVEIFAHVKELCPKRLVCCGYCDLEVLFTELEKHVEYCGSRTERCKGCTKYVQFKHLQFHYEHDHKYLKPEEKDRADQEGYDSETSEECPICLGPVTLPLALECGHVFCMVCVKGIANTTKNCAICRRDIPRDMLMDVRFCREEDVIKNYVNKPKNKKTTRSQSVPGRFNSGSQIVTPHVVNFTEDYDSLVSALLSTRTSSPSYRYQRPNNTHTPLVYTPYSYANTISTTTCSELGKDSLKDDDCCCSTSSSSAKPAPSSSSSSTAATKTSSKNLPSTTASLPSATSSEPKSSTPAAKPSTVQSSARAPTPSKNPLKPSPVLSTANKSESKSTSSSVATSTTTTTTTTQSAVSSVQSSTSSTPRTAGPSSPSPRTVGASSPATSSPSAPLSGASAISASYMNGARPRRPTSLALTSTTNTQFSASSPACSAGAEGNSSTTSKIGKI